MRACIPNHRCVGCSLRRPGNRVAASFPSPLRGGVRGGGNDQSVMRRSESDFRNRTGVDSRCHSRSFLRRSAWVFTPPRTPPLRGGVRGGVWIEIPRRCSKFWLALRFFRHSRTAEHARPFGNPAEELPKARYCVCDESCAGSPAFDSASPPSAEDDEARGFYFASSSFTFAASCGSENGFGRKAKLSEPMLSRKASFG